MDQTPWFSDLCPFLHTLKNGSCWKRTWHNWRQPVEETALPALSGGYFTLLSSRSFEIPWDVPLLWNCIKFCHCFIQAVKKPIHCTTAREGSLRIYQVSPSWCLCLKPGHHFLWSSWGWFIPVFNPAAFCCRIRWIQTRNTGPIPHNLESFC